MNLRVLRQPESLQAFIPLGETILRVYWDGVDYVTRFSFQGDNIGNLPRIEQLPDELIYDIYDVIFGASGVLPEESFIFYYEYARSLEILTDLDGQVGKEFMALHPETTSKVYEIVKNRKEFLEEDIWDVLYDQEELTDELRTYIFDLLGAVIIKCI